MSIRKIDIVSLGILLILQILLFPPAMFNSSNLLASKYSDVITQHLPHQIFIRQTLLQHKRFPLWDPYECAGTPAYPNPIYLTLAFPHMLLVWLPPPLAMNVGFLIHIILAGALSYAFARKTGCSPPASLFAALVFSLGARSLSLVQGGIYPLATYLLYVPLLFFCAERCISRPSIRNSALMAGCITLALLTGEIQMLLYSIPLIFLFSLLRCRISSDRMGAVASPGKTLCSVFAGILLCIPLSAFYLLPARHLYPLLTRSWPLGGAQFSMMPGIPTLRLLLNPWLLNDFNPSAELPWETVLYIGLAPLMVIAWAFFRRSYRRDLALWGSLALVTLLFSLGELKAIHHPFNNLFPVLALFRNPGRMLFFLPFFTAMLAGKGLHLFLAEEPSKEKNRHAVRFQLCIFVIVGIVLCSFFVSTLREDVTHLTEQYRQRFSTYFGGKYLSLVDKKELMMDAAACKIRTCNSLAFQLLILTALAALFALCNSRKMPPRLCGILLLAIAYADLFYFGRQYLEVHPLDEIYPPSPLCLTLDRIKQSSRLADSSAPHTIPYWTAFPFARSTALDISRIDGYTPINLKSYINYMDILSKRPEIRRPRWGITASSIAHPELLSILNTGFLLSESPQVGPPFTVIEKFTDVPVYRQFLGAGTIQRLFLYRNDDPMPEAWLVPEAVACAPSEEDHKLTSLDFRAKALLPHSARTLNHGEPYRAVPVSRHAPDLIGMELETRLPAYLCLSEVWTPGWKATDNGKPVDVVRIDKIIRGIYLKPGKHSIHMSYHPPGLTAGAIISILSAISLIVATAISRKS